MNDIVQLPYSIDRVARFTSDSQRIVYQAESPNGSRPRLEITDVDDRSTSTITELEDNSRQFMSFAIAGGDDLVVYLDQQRGSSVAPTDGQLFVADIQPRCKGHLVTIRATPGDDLIVGTAGADVIDAGSGHDIVQSRGRNDIVCAGSGRDTVRGGRGRDNIDGGNGADTLVGNAGRDIIRGGARNDVARGGQGRDHLFGQKGNDRLDGGQGRDLCAGGTGEDTLKRCRKP